MLSSIGCFSTVVIGLLLITTAGAINDNTDASDNYGDTQLTDLGGLSYSPRRLVGDYEFLAEVSFDVYGMTLSDMKRIFGNYDNYFLFFREKLADSLEIDIRRIRREGAGTGGRRLQQTGSQGDVDKNELYNMLRNPPHVYEAPSPMGHGHPSVNINYVIMPPPNVYDISALEASAAHVLQTLSKVSPFARLHDQEIAQRAGRVGSVRSFVRSVRLRIHRPPTTTTTPCWSPTTPCWTTTTTPCWTTTTPCWTPTSTSTTTPCWSTTPPCDTTTSTCMLPWTTTTTTACSTTTTRPWWIPTTEAPCWTTTTTPCWPPSAPETPTTTTTPCWTPTSTSTTPCWTTTTTPCWTPTSTTPCWTTTTTPCWTPTTPCWTPTSTTPCWTTTTTPCWTPTTPPCWTTTTTPCWTPTTPCGVDEPANRVLRTCHITRAILQRGFNSMDHYTHFVATAISRSTGVSINRIEVHYPYEMLPTSSVGPMGLVRRLKGVNDTLLDDIEFLPDEDLPERRLQDSDFTRMHRACAKGVCSTYVDVPYTIHPQRGNGGELTAQKAADFITHQAATEGSRLHAEYTANLAHRVGMQLSELAVANIEVKLKNLDGHGGHGGGHGDVSNFTISGRDEEESSTSSTTTTSTTPADGSTTTEDASSTSTSSSSTTTEEGVDPTDPGESTTTTTLGETTTTTTLGETTTTTSTTSFAYKQHAISYAALAVVYAVSFMGVVVVSM